MDLMVMNLISYRIYVCMIMGIICIYKYKLMITNRYIYIFIHIHDNTYMQRICIYMCVSYIHVYIYI